MTKLQVKLETRYVSWSDFLMQMTEVIDSAAPSPRPVTPYTSTPPRHISPSNLNIGGEKFKK